MKAVKMRMQKFSRPLVILLAIVVAILTSMVVANATQTITTPNAASISYNLAAGKDSAVITPATNRSVSIMGCCTTAALDSVGQVNLLISLAGGDMDWAGLESPNSITPNTSTITSGTTGFAGTHILWIDFGHFVDIQSASASTIKIHNANTVNTLAGSVTLIW